MTIRTTVVVLFAQMTLVHATPAERVYRLVDYPHIQQTGGPGGLLHHLSGTITTTDSAPDDGLLDAEEIVAWEWASTYWDHRPLEGDHQTHPRVRATGVSITPRSISFPLDAPARFDLESYFNTLQWNTRVRIMDDAPVFSSSYFLAEVGFDGYAIYWAADLASAGADSWVIATAVPEPATTAAAVMGVVLLMAARPGAAERASPGPLGRAWGTRAAD